VADPKREGYSLCRRVGQEHDLSYELYVNHANDGGEDWLVRFEAAGYLCSVRCDGWPDLIELLAKLSTIILAGLIRDEDHDGRPCPPHLPVKPVKPH
jgi:hypothetical protein